jgi:hypothetical protein
MFNVGVFKPHYASHDHESEIRFLPHSNNVVEADTAKEAFLTVAEPLPRIEGRDRRLLEKEFGSKFVGKKGYSILVVKMEQHASKVWEIPSRRGIEFVG